MSARWYTIHLATSNGSYPRHSSQYAPSESRGEDPEARAALRGRRRPRRSEAPFGQSRMTPRSGARSGRRTDPPEERECNEPAEIQDTELRPRQKGDGDRREEHELAHDRGPLEGEHGREDGPCRYDERHALGHHSADRDGRRDRHRQCRHQHGPPRRDQASSEQIDRDRRERKEERVRELEPRIGGDEAPRQPQDQPEDARRGGARTRTPRRAASTPRLRRATRLRSCTALRRDARAGRSRVRQGARRRRTRQRRSLPAREQTRASETRSSRAGMVVAPRDAPCCALAKVRCGS